jgi:hypothetical protein
MKQDVPLRLGIDSVIRLFAEGVSRGSKKDFHWQATFDGVNHRLGAVPDGHGQRAT